MTLNELGIICKYTREKCHETIVLKCSVLSLYPSLELNLPIIVILHLVNTSVGPPEQSHYTAGKIFLCGKLGQCSDVNWVVEKKKRNRSVYLRTGCLSNNVMVMKSWLTLQGQEQKPLKDANCLLAPFITADICFFYSGKPKSS